jgi:hypothetical protein
VSGHSGAAVLAAHFLARTTPLDERTHRALRAQVDAFVERNKEDFDEPSPGPGRADVGRLVETLDAQIGAFRGNGHDAIYGALALRALHEQPALATPAVLDGLCLVLAQIAARSPVEETAWNQENPLPPYVESDAIAEITLRAILRPWNDVRRVGASGVLHWVTHAEALVTLDALGYPDLARRGHAAHRLHMNAHPPESGGRPPDRAAVEWTRPEYWESDAPRRLFGGTWLAGHAFKLPFSLFELLRRTDDPALRLSALVRASHLLVPFE